MFPLTRRIPLAGIRATELILMTARVRAAQLVFTPSLVRAAQLVLMTTRVRAAQLVFAAGRICAAKLILMTARVRPAQCVPRVRGSVRTALLTCHTGPPWPLYRHFRRRSARLPSR